MRDLMNGITIKRVLSPVATPADNTAQVGEIIDHQGAHSVTYVILTGSLPDADATFTVLLEHGDQSNLSDAAAVPDDELLGTEALAGFQFDDDNECRKLGYRGNKRYSRLTITPANNTGASLLAACAIIEPVRTPAVNPPA
jgi:hypothetical protein